MSLSQQEQIAYALRSGEAESTTFSIAVDSRKGFVPDLKQYWLPVTYANGQAEVVIGHELACLVDVTTAQGSNALHIVGDQPLRAPDHLGHPLKVTLCEGIEWSGVVQTISNKRGGQTIGLASPGGAPVSVSASARQTLSVGTGFSQADVGKSLFLQGILPLAPGSIVTVIAAVTGVNKVVLADAITQQPSVTAVPMRVCWGTDNYIPLSKLIKQATWAGVRNVIVHGMLFASKWPKEVARVFLRGSGTVFVPPTRHESDYGATDASPPGYIQKFVIPFEAPEASIPQSTLQGDDLMPGLAGTDQPVVAFIGASTFTSDSGLAGMMSSPVRLIRNRLQIANMGRKSFKFHEFAMGGQTILQYSGASPRTYKAHWDTDPSLPWMGLASQPGFLFQTRPNHVFFESSSNDAIGVNVIRAIEQIHAILATYNPRCSATWVINSMKSLACINTFHAWYDHNARYLESYCQVHAIGCINLRREFIKRRDGFDPCLDLMRQVRPFTSSLSGRFTTLAGNTKAWVIGLTYNGNALSFWSEIGKQIGFTLANGVVDRETLGFNCLYHIGYDKDGTFPGGTPDSLYYQVDLSTTMPGRGLPGTCTPTVLGGYTIEAGSNRLTYQPAYGGPGEIFSPADHGGILTVPSAGHTDPEHPEPHVTGYATTVFAKPEPAPLVGYMKFVTPTEVHLYKDAGLVTELNAVTSLSAAAPQFVYRGSPRVYPGISGIANDDRPVTNLRVWSISGEVGFWWQTDRNTVSSVAVTPGQASVMMVAFGRWLKGGSLRIATDNDGTPDFWVSDYVINRPTLLDEDALGHGGQAYDPNWAQCAGPYGGSGENHPAGPINRVWWQVLNAIDFRVRA